jgi:hypothetical protein
MKSSILLCGILLGCLAVACDKEPTPSTPAPAAAPNAPPAPQFKPEYSLTISTSDAEPKQYTVVWSAQVNTGGWKLTTDRVLVEDSMGKTQARVYAILEEPGPGEMVTQATEKLTGTHDAGTTRIDSAELSIKRTRRGGEPSFMPVYAVVKRIG